MPPATKKAAKLGRALKTAASSATKLPGMRAVTAGRGSGRPNLSPEPGELPIASLKVQVVGCKDVLAKDKSGTSDPFVAVSFLRQRHQTPVCKRTVNPSYASKDATFEFPIFASLAPHIGSLEFVVWDKDILTKDYLGEVALPFDDWFTKNHGSYAFDDPANTEFMLDIVSTRKSTPTTGSLTIKLGIVPHKDSQQFFDAKAVYTELVQRKQGAGMTLMSAPPTEGIGTVPSQYDDADGFQDDGLSSDDEDSGDEIDRYVTPTSSPQPLEAVALPPVQDTPGSDKTLKPPSPKYLPKVFGGRSRPPASQTPSYDTTASVTSAVSETPSRPGTPSGKRRPTFRRSWGSKKSDYNFSASNDIMGIVMLEIKSAEDLPKWKNMTRTGWDMDPFAVISFGKKVFRTRVVRHSLNPVWEEKLLFHVRRYESQFKINFVILDWDKLSSNDHVGDASLDLQELRAKAPVPDPATGLYAEDASELTEMQEFKLPLTSQSSVLEGKHNPHITFRAKYQPYAALRQRFWRQYLKQYDTEDSGHISHLELTSMLDSLGSTLGKETVNSFFSRFNKSTDGELTVNEAIMCLEAEISKPHAQRKRLSDLDDTTETGTTTGLITPGEPIKGTLPELGQLNFSGPPVHTAAVAAEQASHGKSPSVLPAYATEPSQQPVTHALRAEKRPSPPRIPSSDSETGLELSQSTFTVSPEGSTLAAGSGAQGGITTSSSSGDESTSNGEASDDSVERVINIRNCPLCHRPRMNAKAEMDIITHLAVCASQDWARVDRIVVGNFVTASQAQRKWYTKVISVVSAGSYQIGANSANIIVQNRMTGQLEEEKMQVYVRLGIRLLYKGARGRMEGARARRLLKSLSIKQGLKYDSPESAREIPAFIQFHKLNVDEILDPLDSFKSFNQFFYRKLKSSARPVSEPQNPSRLVSCADCRMMTFETVHEATKLWIKGREFSVQRLLGEGYKDEAHKYNGGALAIFRLAPQDYHRFHSPVDGKIGPMTYISGEYYTVNPQAIRTSLDVYGENARKIVPIDSPTFGRVMAVCIGAMMVGTIVTTVKEGDTIKRGEEFGYFAFGGSTIVCLFEKGAVEWDEDLLINGRASLETLVRVGMGIGKKPT